MALHFHRAERTDLLADGLGALLSDPLPDPFAEELVIVPAKGVERWLSQRLSHILGRADCSDGVCAGVSFRSPRSLIAAVGDLFSEVSVTSAQPPKRRQPVAVPGSVRTKLDNGLRWAPMFSGLVLRAGSSYTNADSSLFIRRCARTTA